MALQPDPTNFGEIFGFLSRFNEGGTSDNFGKAGGVSAPTSTSAGNIAGDNLQAQIQDDAGAEIPTDELTDEQGNKFNISNVLGAIADALAIYASNNPGQTFSTLIGQKLRDKQITAELAQSTEQFRQRQELDLKRLTASEEEASASRDLTREVAQLRSDTALTIATQETESNETQTKNRIAAQENIVGIQESGATTRNRDSILAQFKITDKKISGELERTRTAGQEQREGIRLQGNIAEDADIRAVTRDLNTKFIGLGLDPAASSRISTAIATDSLGSLDFPDAQLMEAFLMFREAVDKENMKEAKKAFLEGQFLIPDVEFVTNPETGVMESQQRRTLTGETVFRQATYNEKQEILSGKNINEVGIAAAHSRNADKLIDDNGQARKNPDGTLIAINPSVSSGPIDTETIAKIDETRIEEMMANIFDGSHNQTVGSALTEVQKLRKNGLADAPYFRALDILKAQVEEVALVSLRALDNQEITLEQLESQLWKDALFSAKMYWLRLEKLDKYLPSNWPGRAYAYGLRRDAKKANKQTDVSKDEN